MSIIEFRQYNRFLGWTITCCNRRMQNLLTGAIGPTLRYCVVNRL